MDRDAIRQHIENIKSNVEYVLIEYCSAKGCPCDYKPFVYWAGKQQGPGWQDNIQNQLVKSALKSGCFSKINNYEKSYWLEGSYVCDNCGTEWNYFSEEWRMLAFHNRFLKIGGDDPGKLYEELIGSDIFTSVGFEPAGKNTLSLEQWVAFMLGRNYKAEPYQASVPAGETEAGFRKIVLSCISDYSMILNRECC